MTAKRNVISGFESGTEKRTLMEKLTKSEWSLEFSLKQKYQNQNKTGYEWWRKHIRGVCNLVWVVGPGKILERTNVNWSTENELELARPGRWQMGGEAASVFLGKKRAHVQGPKTHRENIACLRNKRQNTGSTVGKGPAHSKSWINVAIYYLCFFLKTCLHISLLTNL